MIIENDSWRLRIGTVDKNQGKRKSEKGRRESIYKEKDCDNKRCVRTD